MENQKETITFKSLRQKIYRAIGKLSIMAICLYVLLPMVGFSVSASVDIKDFNTFDMHVRHYWNEGYLK